MNDPREQRKSFGTTGQHEAVSTVRLGPKPTNLGVGLSKGEPHSRLGGAYHSTCRAPWHLLVAFPDNPSKHETLLVRLKWDAVLRELRVLEQQTSNLRHAGAMVTRASALGDVHIAARATRDAQSALVALALATTTIRQQVVPADGLGDALDSLAELALRATRMVVLASVFDLRELLHGSAVSGPTHRLLLGGFQKIAPLLHEELERILDVWMPYRKDAVTGNRVLYRTAVRAAQQAVSKLAADPELARFRALAAARTDWPAVPLATMRLAAALAVRIDAEPNNPLFTISLPPARSEQRDHARLDEVAPAASHSQAMNHRRALYSLHLSVHSISKQSGRGR
jgi:hypothetical protein